MHSIRRQLRRFLWDSIEIAQNRRQTKYTEHASKKIRPSKRLELFIQTGSTPTPWETETQTMVCVFPSQKLRPWSEFLLSLVNTESGVV